MTLDITQVYGQIESMAGEMRSHRAGYAQRLAKSVETLKSAVASQEKLSHKIETSHTSWLLAGLKEGIGLHKVPAPLPADFCVVGSDGSHIDVDRHHSERLFLLNMGVIYLQYGSNPDAEFISSPTLYFGDEMLNIRSADGKQVAIEGPLLGIKRHVEECRSLADRVCATGPGLPVLGLVDGTLIMWSLEGHDYERYVSDQLLDEGLLRQFDRFHELNKSKSTAVASYISFPRSADVSNVLRLHLCPHDPVDCNKYCGGKLEGRPCDEIGNVIDRALFGEVLKHRERSALFFSRSSINKRYGMHSVCFFYIKLDEEVVRVEVPQWVADNETLLDFTHAAIIDQCDKGFGYPVALSEAHEQAVVTGADREQFWDLVDRVLQSDNVASQRSLKQRSKKVRWI
jgi:hypothetical protein